MTNFLLSALSSPVDWLKVGLLAGPVGLILIGVGATALLLSSASDREQEI